MKLPETARNPIATVKIHSMQCENDHCMGKLAGQENRHISLLYDSIFKVFIKPLIKNVQPVHHFLKMSVKILNMEDKSLYKIL